MSKRRSDGDYGTVGIEVHRVDADFAVVTSGEAHLDAFGARESVIYHIPFVSAGYIQD